MNFGFKLVGISLALLDLDIKYKDWLHALRVYLTMDLSQGERQSQVSDTI